MEEYENAEILTDSGSGVELPSFGDLLPADITV